MTTKQTCRARHGDLTCQRPFPHPAPHRAEAGVPVPKKGGNAGELEAQVVSWEDSR